MSGTLTDHQIRRIRTADAQDIAKMVDQERYWTPQSLQKILRRVETLNVEDPVQALSAGLSAVAIVEERLIGPPPDLHAMTLADRAATLRCNGKLEDAHEVYRQALAIDGLTQSGRSYVLARMAVTQALMGNSELALETIHQALREVSDRIPALVVRGWILMVSGDLAIALEDCLAALDAIGTDYARSDYSLLFAIINACNILSYHAGLEIEPKIYDRMLRTIDGYRQTFPTAGSNYYKVQQPRLMLSRAEALIFMRTGREEQAIPILRRVARGLSKKYPDDALAAYSDLMVTLTSIGELKEAAREAELAYELLEKTHFEIQPLGRKSLKVAANKERMGYGEAIEIRMMLRPPQLATQTR